MCLFTYLFFNCLPLEGRGNCVEVRNLFLRTNIAVTGEATPWLLSSVLGSSLQEGYWGAATCPKKGSEGCDNMSDEWLRELWMLIWRKGTLGGPCDLLPQRQMWGLVLFAMSQVKVQVPRRNPERFLWDLAEGTEVSECLFVKGPSLGVVLMCLNWTEGFGHFPVWVTE